MALLSINLHYFDQHPSYHSNQTLQVSIIFISLYLIFLPSPHGAMGHSPLMFPDCLTDQVWQVHFFHKLKMWTHYSFECIKSSHFSSIVVNYATKPLRL